MSLTPQLATNIRVPLGQPGRNGRSAVHSVIRVPSLVTGSVFTETRGTMAVRVKLLSSYPVQMLFASSGQSGLNGHLVVSLASADFGIGKGNVSVKLDRVKANLMKQVTVLKETVRSGQIGALPASARSHAEVVCRKWSVNVSTEK